MIWRKIPKVLAFLALTVGIAQAQDLGAVLDEAAPPGDQAAVLYLWKDGQGHGAALGRLRPGGRAARVGDRFAIASVGKTFLSVAILQLVERGVLELDQAAAGMLPDAVAAQFRGLKRVTLAHLLGMRSGLPDYYDEAYLDAVLEDRSQQTPRRALEFAAGERALFRPGRRFDYSNTNYVLLQLILEQATGQSMAGYFKRHIFAPAGLQRSYVFGSQPHQEDFVGGTEDLGSGPEDVSFYYLGQGFGDGPLISSAEDLVRFYRALFVERKLLGAAMLARLVYDPLGEGYGFGIEVENIRGLGTVYGHSGGDLGFSSDVRYARDLNAIVVVLLAQGDADTGATFEVLRLLGG